MPRIHRPGAVKLLDQQHARQGVRQRQVRQAQALVGGLVISEAGSQEAADAVACRERGVVLERIG